MAIGATRGNLMMTLTTAMMMACCGCALLTGARAAAQIVPPPTQPAVEPERKEEQWLIPFDQRPAFGEYRERKEIFAASMWTGVLTNGVRVSLRYFPLEKQTAQVQVAFFGGGLQEDASTRGLTEAAIQAWTTPALNDMSHEELFGRLKGWNVGATGEVAGDLARLTVAGDNVHVEQIFQLAYLLSKKPKIEATALEEWRKAKLSEIDARMRGTRAAFPHVMMDALFPKDDVRGRALTREQVEAITLEKAQAWLDKLVETSPIEIGFVGRVPQETVLDMVQRYFSGLSARPEVTTATNAALRQVARRTDMAKVDVTMESVTPRAVVAWAFWACDEYDYDRMFPLQIAARVATRRFDATLKQMLPERENRAGISWALNPASTFPGMGLFMGVATTPAAKADDVHALMLRELRAMAEAGVTEAEMLEAQTALREQWQDRLKDAGPWAMVLESYAYTGVDAAKLYTIPDLVMQVTPEQVREQLKAVVDATPAASVVLRPTLRAGAQAVPVPAPVEQPKTADN
jgi:predicted Zn-dependent peptidase